MNEKRVEYYHLNHYNINQITYLCKTLASCKDGDFPDQVYVLLESVNCNMSSSQNEVILEALDSVTKISDDSDSDDEVQPMSVGMKCLKIMF